MTALADERTFEEHTASVYSGSIMDLRGLTAHSVIPNGRDRPILLKKAGPPTDAAESQKCWRGEVPQIVLRGIKVQSNALSAPLVTGKTA